MGQGFPSLDSKNAPFESSFVKTFRKLESTTKFKRLGYDQTPVQKMINIQGS